LHVEQITTAHWAGGLGRCPGGCGQSGRARRRGRRPVQPRRRRRLVRPSRPGTRDVATVGTATEGHRLRATQW